METFSKANGKMTKPMGMESTSIKMVLDMRESGKTISSTAKAKKSGPIIQCTRATTMKERSMGRDSISGKMDLVIMANGTKIELKERASTSGKTAERTLESGKIIICMEKVSTPGPMAGDTTVNTKWTRSTGMVYTSGLMDVFMKVIGSMESSMAKANIFYKTAS